MGLFSRLAALFHIRANAALDKLEKPGEVMDYSYSKQLEQLQQLRRSIADVVTEEKRLVMLQTELKDKSNKIEDQARQALLVNNEELARRALQRQQEWVLQINEYERQIALLRGQEEKLLQREFTLEDVAFAQSPLAFEIKWSDDLPVKNDVFDVGCILGNRVDDRIAEGFFLIIPVQTGAQFVGRILDEAGEHVFAGWCDRWVGERRDDHINVRMAREVAVLGIVVGTLHVFD